MEKENINISIKEYRRLLEAEIRLNILAEYARKEKYSINKQECAALLGVDLGGDDD